MNMLGMADYDLETGVQDLKPLQAQLGCTREQLCSIINFSNHYYILTTQFRTYCFWYHSLVTVLKHTSMYN